MWLTGGQDYELRVMLRVIMRVVSDRILPLSVMAMVQVSVEASDRGKGRGKGRAGKVRDKNRVRSRVRGRDAACFRADVSPHPLYRPWHSNRCTPAGCSNRYVGRQAAARFI